MHFLAINHEMIRQGFLADIPLDFLPFNPEWWAGKHVVEMLARQAVVRQRISEHEVANALPLDQHVSLADRVRLAVQFLPVHG